MRGVLQAMALSAPLFIGVIAPASAMSLAGEMSDWTVTLAEYEATARKIEAQPGADGDTSYFVAPEALLGDWSRADRILLEKKSWGGRYYKDKAGDIGDVILDGPAGRAMFRLPEDHSGEWRAFTVPLEPGQWQLSKGAESLAQVLADVTRFRIRAEYGYGKDYSALRGVVVVHERSLADDPQGGWTPVGEPVTKGVDSLATVGNGPSRPSTFEIASPMRLERIVTYHWNQGEGARPGTIGLRDQAGHRLGPWKTTGSEGQGGVPDAYWHARPGIVLEAGAYTVIDSSPKTWATNDEVGGRGIFKVTLQRVVRSGPSQDATASGSDVAGEEPKAGQGEDHSIREDLDVSDLIRDLEAIVKQDQR